LHGRVRGVVDEKGDSGGGEGFGCAGDVEEGRWGTWFVVEVGMAEGLGVVVNKGK
jgi:hypothetical protein